MLVLVFSTYTCLSPGEPCLRKRFLEGALHEQPLDKRAVSCVLTGSEGTVEAVGLSSSTPVVSGGAAATKRCLSICEGELCPVLLIQAQIDSHLFEHPPSLTFNRTIMVVAYIALYLQTLVVLLAVD